MDDCSIKDLARREPDGPIFTRLGLTYGKAVKLRKEFGELCSSYNQDQSTMATIASFTPEMRRLYLSK